MCVSILEPPLSAAFYEAARQAKGCARRGDDFRFRGQFRVGAVESARERRHSEADAFRFACLSSVRVRIRIGLSAQACTGAERTGAQKPFECPAGGKSRLFENLQG